MPTFGLHLPDDSPLAEKIKARADARHDGKVSAYIRKLVEQDLGKGPGVTPLMDLVDRYSPARSIEGGAWIARAMNRTEGSLNQPRVIAAVLDALIDSDPNEVIHYHYGLIPLRKGAGADAAIQALEEGAARSGMDRARKERTGDPGHAKSG